MPCGGIFSQLSSEPIHPCWVCEKPTNELFVWEWDSTLCRSCLGQFLQSDEGRVVLHHRHHIEVSGDPWISLHDKPEDCVVCDQEGAVLKVVGGKFPHYTSCLGSFLTKETQDAGGLPGGIDIPEGLELTPTS